jgi:hypothetical protein
VLPKALDRFLRLSSGDRSLLARSIVLVATARVALWVLPFKVARRVLTLSAKRSPAVHATPERIGWAISAARYFVPKGNCLPQALAAESLLLRHGHPVEFRIGVVKTDRDRLEAHAWVESAGRLVVGDLTQGLVTYSPLPPLPGAKV